jgi:predicted transcriptional regulator
MRMAEEETPTRTDPGLIAETVKSYVARHKVPADELAELIASVHRSLSDLGRPVARPETRSPAIPIRRSVQHEHVACLECGYRGQFLRRHILVRHGLSPEAYRARWSLPMKESPGRGLGQMGTHSSAAVARAEGPASAQTSPCSGLPSHSGTC